MAGRHYTEKDLGLFSIKKFGAVGDGVADDTQAIKDAIVDLKDGDTLYFPAGDYKVTDSLYFGNKAINLKGQGRKSRIVVGSGYNYTGNSNVIKFGYASDEPASKVNVTVDVAKGDSEITVASTSGIVAGDYVMLLSDERITPVALSSDWRKGEILRVRDVNATTKKIGFYERTHDSYASSTAGIRKIGMHEGLLIEDMAFHNPYPNQTTLGFLSIVNYVNVNVKNIHMKQSDGVGLTLNNVIAANVSELVCEDFTNNETNNKYGYGISVERGSQQITVSNSHFKRCRHGFTTNGGNADGYRYGVPRHIIVKGCTSVEGSQAQFDTHPIGEYITFMGCSVQGARVMADPFGTTYGNSVGFQIRSSQTKIVNCEVNGADDGIWFDVQAKRNEVSNTTISNSTRNGIRFIDNYSAANGGSQHTLIKNVTITESGDEAISVLASNNNVLIQGCYIDGVSKKNASKAAIYVDKGAHSVRAIGNTILDSSGATILTAINFSGVGKATSYNCIAKDNLIQNSTNRVGAGLPVGWVASTAYVVGDMVFYGTNVYRATTAGTSGTATPVHVAGLATDGVVTWEFVGRTNVVLNDVDDYATLFIPNNVIGGRSAAQFDIGTENGKKLRFQRNSTGDIEFLFGDAGVDTSIKNGGIIDTKGDVLSGGFIRSGKVTSLPTPSASYRGMLTRIEASNGFADSVYVCVKKADDTYDWAQLF